MFEMDERSGTLVLDVCEFCFFQAEDGIRDLVRSRGLGDVYKRQMNECQDALNGYPQNFTRLPGSQKVHRMNLSQSGNCLLYTSDAADDLLCVDLGGRRIIKKKN